MCVEDGYALSEYEFDATVLAIPGHSKGSIGILTAGGDLFCGDLFSNTDKPVLNAIMDDLAAANASLEKLKNFAINAVYPGHGRPFLNGTVHEEINHMNTRPSTVCAATRWAIAGSCRGSGFVVDRLFRRSAGVADCYGLTPIAATVPRADGLTAEEAATLGSLAKVDDYPLYTMRYYGTFPARKLGGHRNLRNPCEYRLGLCLFAALGDPQNRLYGRNFDWHFSPALLLYTAPFDGYASVSMVDLEYFGFSDRTTGRVVDPMTLSLAERRSLLTTPSMPFDGMNAGRVAIGMAAVSQADERHDPDKPTIGEIAVIREILDHAGSVAEAVAILKQYNIDWEGGLPLHYLVADRSGRAALVEIYGGEIAVIPESDSWHRPPTSLAARSRAMQQASARATIPSSGS